MPKWESEVAREDEARTWLVETGYKNVCYDISRDARRAVYLLGTHPTGSVRRFRIFPSFRRCKVTPYDKENNVHFLVPDEGEFKVYFVEDVEGGVDHQYKAKETYHAKKARLLRGGI